MPTKRKSLSRLHSTNPADIEWRRNQAHIDADIEGMPSDANAERLAADLRALGLAPEERIKLLVSRLKIRAGRAVA